MNQKEMAQAEEELREYEEAQWRELEAYAAKWVPVRDAELADLEKKAWEAEFDSDMEW